MCWSSSEPISGLGGLVDAGAARRVSEVNFVLAARVLELSGDWALDGSVSMAAWMRHHLRMSHAEASKVLRDGRFLTDHRLVREAVLSGRLSLGQVAAIRANVPAAVAGLFAEFEQTIVDAVVGLSVRDTEIVCQRWRQQGENVVDVPEPWVPERSWTSSTLPDGTVVGRFVLDPAGAAQLEQALGVGKRFDGAGDVRTRQVRDADALVAVLAFFNANHDRAGTPRHRPHLELVLHADLDVTDPFDQSHIRGFHLNGINVFARPHAFTRTGSTLSHTDTEALLCDCVLHRVLKARSAVLDYGHSIRTVPTPLFRAVACRDGGCRFPGCDRPISWCDAHHISWWQHGGHTALPNLLLLCSHHHHLIHNHGWQIVLHPNGDAHFTLPNGLIRTSKPRHQPPIRAPIAA